MMKDGHQSSGALTMNDIKTDGNCSFCHARSKKITGLTTATAIWVSAAIGVASGAGLHMLTVFGALITVTVLRVGRLRKELSQKLRQYAAAREANRQKALMEAKIRAAAAMSASALKKGVTAQELQMVVNNQRPLPVGGANESKPTTATAAAMPVTTIPPPSATTITPPASPPQPPATPTTIPAPATTAAAVAAAAKQGTIVIVPPPPRSSEVKAATSQQQQEGQQTKVVAGGMVPLIATDLIESLPSAPLDISGGTTSTTSSSSSSSSSSNGAVSKPVTPPKLEVSAESSSSL